MLISVKISQVNFKLLLSCRFQTSIVVSISNFYCHFNFKLLQSCQFQTPAVMSSQFQSIFTMQFAICSAKWLVRIQEQLVPFNSFLLSAKWLVQIQGQLVPANFLLLSAKWLVRIQEQLVLVNLLMLSAKRLVQIQEQLVPIYLSVFSVKFPVRAKRTTCTCQFVVCFPSTLLFAILLMSTNPAMDTTYFVKLNSQFVLHS